MNTAGPIHVLMRFSDKLGGIADTIATHELIIKRQGAVWLGKMGKPLGRNHIERINKQCTDGIPTYLYLVQRIKGRYELYRGEVMEMSRHLPRDPRLIPSYYSRHKLENYMTLWIKLSAVQPIETNALNNLLISNSLSAVAYTLPRSMAALFIVREGRGIHG